MTTNTLRATTICTALVDYRAELLRMSNKYPQMFAANEQVIKEIDDALLSISGNITSVQIIPNTCNPNI